MKILCIFDTRFISYFKIKIIINAIGTGNYKGENI